MQQRLSVVQQMQQINAATEAAAAAVVHAAAAAAAADDPPPPPPQPALGLLGRFLQTAAEKVDNLAQDVLGPRPGPSGTRQARPPPPPVITRSGRKSEPPDRYPDPEKRT